MEMLIFYNEYQMYSEDKFDISLNIQSINDKKVFSSLLWYVTIQMHF